MKVALCQRRSVLNDVDANLSVMMKDIDTTDADMYVYPELFLTGYGFDRDSVEPGLCDALMTIEEISKKKNVAVVVGAPEFEYDRIYNRAYVFTPDGTLGYRKIHLPGFGSFAEDRVFTPGKETVSFEFGEHRFGLSICYDIFFPEILKICSYTHGTDVNICISASPVASQPFFERVLPARALENTSYLLFVNNIGTIGEFEFFGGTRALAPDGDLIRMSFEECVKTVEISSEVVDNVRKGRPVLKDTVFESTYRG